MKHLFAAMCASLFLSVCGSSGSVKPTGFGGEQPQFDAAPYQTAISAGTWVYDSIAYTFEGVSARVPVQIFFPKGYSDRQKLRTLIVLHGYRGGMRDWQANTDIAYLANRYSVALVCPAMANTIYESEYFPETVNKWGPLPGGRFVPQVLIPWLRNRFSLASKKDITGIMGNSTGGRGAVLAAVRTPELFAAAAGLSGDYDPDGMPRNRLLASVYGSYKSFKDRWANIDNTMAQAENLRGIPVFLGHGEKDSVVPKEQSLVLAMRIRQLEKEKRGYSVTYKEYSYSQHDWRYWKKALPDVMRFFDENLLAAI